LASRQDAKSQSKGAKFWGALVTEMAGGDARPTKLLDNLLGWPEELEELL